MKLKKHNTKKKLKMSTTRELTKLGIRIKIEEVSCRFLFKMADFHKCYRRF